MSQTVASSSAPNPFFAAGLTEADPEIAKAIELEPGRHAARPPKPPHPPRHAAHPDAELSCHLAAAPSRPDRRLNARAKNF